MDGLLIILGLVAGLFLAIAPILAWVAIFQIQTLSRKVRSLEARLAWSERPIRQAPGAQTGEATGETAAPGPLGAPAAEEIAREDIATGEVAADQTSDVARTGPEIPDDSPVEEIPSEAPPVPAPAPRSRAEGVEQALTSRWMVWLGALAVGLSAVFLFSYAIEQGWLGPTPRVLLGLTLGAALLAGGEWTHRHPIPGLARAVSPDYVPQALTASGLFALYASLYAAHAVFGLIGPSAAFVALGAVGFAALILAVRQGWFVALLGLAGGYAMPALLESQASAPIPVFVYVFALTVGCLAVMVFRKWPFLAIATLAGSVGWPLLWFAGPWTGADQGVLSVYAVATAAAFAFLSVGFPVKRPDTLAIRWLAGMIADTSGIGFVAQGVILVMLAVIGGFDDAAFLFLGLYAALGMVLGIRRAEFEGLGVASALIMALAFLLWPEPAALTIPDEVASHGVRNWGDTFGPIQMPPEFVTFARAALGFAALYGLGGLLALRRAATPAVWAALSAAVPLYLFTLAYWRIGGLGLSVNWGALAVGLAVAQLAAASIVDRLVSREQRDEALSLYAAGCTAALALAFTCVLREAWLTVALSAELLALAWIWVRLPVTHLRIIAYAVAGAVMVRLVLNPHVLDYEGSAAGLFSWVLYGYGLPAVAFLSAARLFGGPQNNLRHDPLAALCLAGGIAFGFLTVALQLRVWSAGVIVGAPYGLFDQAVQSLWWLLAAAVLLRREVSARSPVLLNAGRALLVLAALQVGLGHLLTDNPLMLRLPVGDVVVFNLLGLAYLAPALVLWLIAAGGRVDLPKRAKELMRVGAGVLLFVYLSLEVRHAFWGSVIVIDHDRLAGDAEVYAYSAVWIVYALVLLALGILRNSSVLRYASLAVLGVTVGKVFLYDMADLTGLYRVASFLGLGLVLIGIGYAYQRFVFQPPAPES